MSAGARHSKDHAGDADAPAVLECLTVHVVSDSIGDSAVTITNAAASQFIGLHCKVSRLANVSTLEEIENYLEPLLAKLRDREEAQPLVVFYTIATPELAEALEEYLKDKNIASVDLISPAIQAIADATGHEPLGTAGLIRRTDKDYFARVEAMEFAVDHDDGRNPEQLKDADIVLIGSSRTSKTPLSIYLASQGYRVANVPLAPGSPPPKELFELEQGRVYGLMSQTSLLSKIRYRRLGNAAGVAGAYAQPENVQADLDEARAVMRTIGCIVVRTDNRAIEETAQEILRYYEAAYPSHKPPVKRYY
ncbi:MAG: kinase/pyrophosphorylase [Coriobacteriales bacterium]|jgi:regulator of PEP synthase PpsR (kinase-PPPase family)|nr:kinase/pyrophosphorylase [Coriobacteriales bacterium]